MPQPKLGREILVLTEADVQATLSMAQALELARAGLGADAAGQVMGDKYYMDLRPAHFVKPFSGYKAGEDLFFVKTFNFFADNVGKGLPVTSSQVLLFDAQTGMLVVFNPLTTPVEKTIRVNLYYTGLTTAAEIREGEHAPRTYSLDRGFNVDVPVKIAAEDMAWFVIE